MKSVSTAPRPRARAMTSTSAGEKATAKSAANSSPGLRTMIFWGLVNRQRGRSGMGSGEGQVGDLHELAA
ncbi:hypothetical protein DSECCO2_581270 [anaerobic digester metagenome]